MAWYDGGFEDLRRSMGSWEGHDFCLTYVVTNLGSSIGEDFALAVVPCDMIFSEWWSIP